MLTLLSKKKNLKIKNKILLKFLVFFFYFFKLNIWGVIFYRYLKVLKKKEGYFAIFRLLIIIYFKYFFFKTHLQKFKNEIDFKIDFFFFGKL